ncbi:MAG TPA: DUF6328 family protein [Burkholderiales bacterium]|nr:DUF6328 family protein [Burkholderiales bacterium]
MTNDEEGRAIEDAGATLGQTDASTTDDGDLSDMLGELRVLLLSAQLLSAFLITVPFNTGFANIVTPEKQLFLATFILSISSLVLLSSPAVQHRLIRPLRDRARFKTLATRQIVAGCVALSLALTLATQLVLSEVFGHVVGMLAAGFVATLIFLLWWLMPRVLKARGRL